MEWKLYAGHTRVLRSPVSGVSTWSSVKVQSAVTRVVGHVPWAYAAGRDHCLTLAISASR